MFEREIRGAAQSLYSFDTDFRKFKVLIAAKYNGVAVAQPAFVMGKDNVTAEFRALSPLGKVPVLTTKDGALFESNAIARYVASLRLDTDLLGRSFFEASQVDMWCDFASHELEVPVAMWLYPIFGITPFHRADEVKAEAEVHKALAVLETHLLHRTFVVGEKITLADITLASALVYPFRFVLDAEARKPYTCVQRWFLTLVNQPEFAAVLGTVNFATERLRAAGADAAGAAAGGGGAAGAAGAGAAGGDKKGKKDKKDKAADAEGAAAAGGGGAAAGAGGDKKGGKGGAPKEAAKPKEDKKKKKEEEEEPEDDGADDDAPKEEKKADPFSALPKTPMSLDHFKRTYSNAPHGEDGKRDFYKAMPEIWSSIFDKEGWSIWHLDYQYNSENKKDFMTSNLIGGFVQRSEEMRKYSFGVHVALGASPPYEVSGVWMIRGQDFKPFIDANGDAEYYTVRKLDSDKPEDRKLIEEYWCSPETIHGKPILDSQVFK
jgi:elongation factor 1-gamma